MAMADQAPQATLNGVGKLQKHGSTVLYCSRGHGSFPANTTPSSLHNSTSTPAAIASWTHDPEKFRTSCYHLHRPSAMRPGVYISTNTSTQYRSTQQSLTFSPYHQSRLPYPPTLQPSPTTNRANCMSTHHTTHGTLAHYFLTTLSPHSITNVAASNNTAPTQ